MNPRYLNLSLFILLAVWIFLILKIDWKRIQLSRILSISFISSVVSTIFVHYVSRLENYYDGLNYFRDYQRPSLGLSNSHVISGIFTLLALLFLFVDLRRLNFTGGEIKWPNKRTIILIFIGFLGIITFPQILSLPIIILGLISWTGVLTVVIGIALIFKLWKSSVPRRRNRLFIYLAVIFYMLIPWVYPELLENKYKLGFDAGFAEAVEKNVDIASIHNWMAEQNHSEFEAYKGDQAYAQLPDFIQSINPSDVRFVPSGEDANSQLIIGYPSTWMDPFGLAFVYPPMNSEQLSSQGYEGSPISDDCSCYIYSPSK